MTARQPPHDSPENDAGGAASGNVGSPVDRFRALARRLVTVPRVDLKREDENGKAGNAARQQGNGKRLANGR